MNGIDALRDAIPGWRTPTAKKNNVLGVFRGEGIGSEVTEACLAVLEAATKGTDVQFTVRQGGAIGKPALKEHGAVLTRDTLEFCNAIFAQEGAVLCGPGGGRFVYELRAALDLYCKITPIAPIPVLGDTGVIKPETRRDVDIVVVREISGGVYLGKWELDGEGPEQRAQHTFSYTAREAERILQIACSLAAARRRRVSIILKPNGIPTVSQLWADVFQHMKKPAGLESEILEVDNATFQLIQTARNFDVVVAPNLLGDIISDVGGLLLGSRGLCFSGNFGKGGIAVYNTGHGAAYNLAGKDLANPLGHLSSVLLALRVTYAQHGIADLIARAIDITVRHGWRTADMAAAGCTIVGTREFTRRIVRAIEDLKQGKPA